MYTVKTLKARVERYIEMGLENNQKERNYASLYIQGKPGTGKSDIIRQICLEKNYNLKVVYMSILPLEKMTGLPSSHEGKIQWSLPEVLNFSDLEVKAGEDRPIVLFLDDAHLINRQIQNYLFELLIYRKLSGYSLGKNTVIILAGNNQDDNANFQSILSPVVNRLSFCQVENNVKDWAEYARNNGVSATVINALLFDESMLYSEPTESIAWSSPRSWTYLGQELKYMEDNNIKIDDNELLEIVGGYVYREHAVKFMKFYKLYSKWDKEKVLNNEFIELIKSNKFDIIDIYSALTKVSAEVRDEGEVEKFIKVVEAVIGISKYRVLIPQILQNIMIDGGVNNPIIEKALDNKAVCEIVFELLK